MGATIDYDKCSIVGVRAMWYTLALSESRKLFKYTEMKKRNDGCHYSSFVAQLFDHKKTPRQILHLNSRVASLEESHYGLLVRGNVTSCYAYSPV
jgi:hypothetical protein